MEKIFGEDEFKGIEEEIDSAIEKLFVEKNKASLDDSKQESLNYSNSYGMIQDLPPKDEYPKFESSPTFFNLLENMETQLLSLEWELTKENIERTRKEVLALKKISNDDPKILNTLEFMEKVLNSIVKGEEDVHPSMIKFLLDSKETVKLLMRKDASNDIEIYKQLAYSGIEARFNYLFSLKDSALPLSKHTGLDITKNGKISMELWEKINLLLKKNEEILLRIQESLSKIEELKGKEKALEKRSERRNLLVNIVVIRVENKLFGIEGDRIVKIFKVPESYIESYLIKPKIRLKGFDVKLIDLNKVFSIQREGAKTEIKILITRDNGFYKGFIIDDVVKRLSAYPNTSEDYGEYFSGLIYTIYHNESVEIPILDIKKF